MAWKSAVSQVGFPDLLTVFLFVFFKQTSALCRRHTDYDCRNLKALIKCFSDCCLITLGPMWAKALEANWALLHNHKNKEEKKICFGLHYRRIKLSLAPVQNTSCMNWVEKVNATKADVYPRRAVMPQIDSVIPLFLYEDPFLSTEPLDKLCLCRLCSLKNAKLCKQTFIDKFTHFASTNTKNWIIYL